MPSPVTQFLSSLATDGRLDPEKASIARLDSAWHYLATFAPSKHRERVDKVIGRVRRTFLSDKRIARTDVRWLRVLDSIARRSPLEVPPPYETPEQLEELIVAVVARYSDPHVRIGSQSPETLIVPALFESTGEIKSVELPFSARTLSRAVNLPADGSIWIEHVKQLVQAKYDVPDPEFDSAVRKVVDEDRLCERNRYVRLSDSEKRRGNESSAQGDFPGLPKQWADDAADELIQGGFVQEATTDVVPLGSGTQARPQVLSLTDAGANVAGQPFSGNADAEDEPSRSGDGEQPAPESRSFEDTNIWSKLDKKQRILIQIHQEFEQELRRPPTYQKLANAFKQRDLKPQTRQGMQKAVKKIEEKTGLALRPKDDPADHSVAAPE